MMDPRILSLALLSRTLRNFQGVILLTKHRLAVEARVLARCCYENMFMVGGLNAEGEAFADRMIEDDQAGRKGRIRFALETENIFESLSVEMQQAVKDFQLPKANFLKPKEANFPAMPRIQRLLPLLAIGREPVIRSMVFTLRPMPKKMSWMKRYT